MNAQQIENALKRTGEQLAELEPRMAELYDERLDLILAGRELVPPMTYRALGAAVGTSEGAVAQLIRKVRLRPVSAD